MDDTTRSRFDHIFDEVLESLPPRIHELIEEVPLLVEDYPSEEVMRQMGVRHRCQLCGLYTGIPLTERSVMQSGFLPDRILIYREGILSASTDRTGRLLPGRLREEMRITVLHELAHHHGFDEQELRDLGYG